MKRDITGEGESKSSSYLWRHLITHQNNLPSSVRRSER